jgi:hypothetical protein
MNPNQQLQDALDYAVAISVDGMPGFATNLIILQLK